MKALIQTLAIFFTASFTFANRPPNIVVMMVDDMGFAGPSIAPYSNPHFKTPGMDRLSSEGMRFTDFHSSGTVCSPTRAGLLTGRYQQRAGIEAVIHPRANHPEHRKWLHTSEVTFAELFQQAGYATGMVGKWHLGYPHGNDEIHPQNHGFDYFKGYHSGNIDYINHWGDHFKHDWWHGRKETVEEGYTTHLINKYALEFIEANRGQPFCLYVAHEAPHAPVQGPNDPPQRGPGRKKRITPHTEAMKQMMLEMDKGVDQVRAKLVELGLEKNTLFLFFSDNGDSPRTATGSQRFRGHKDHVYEGGTRVPAIAWWPGKIEAGSSTDALSITLDVMPTILSVAGIEPDANKAMDGVDLSPVLFENKGLEERTLFWASLSNHGSRSEAMRDGFWKLVVQHPKAKPGTFENEQVELFDLSIDEGETNNLAAEHPDRAAEMLQRIKDWYAETQETATVQPGGWLKATSQPKTSQWSARIKAVDPGSQDEAWAKPGFDDSNWKTMKLPGHFEKAGLPGHDGVVWFRKTLVLTAEQAKTAKPMLGLGQIDDMDVTWVNGRRVGGYELPGHYYTIRNYKVPAGTLQEGKNTIAVRVMDHRAVGGIAGKPGQLVLRLGDVTISLANEWKMAPGANLSELSKEVN